MESTAPKPYVFVLMPFAEEFKDVYELGIKPACLAAGAYCERVDEQIYKESILDRILNQIAKADLIVANLSGKNSNVFYETGYAHALNKSVILLTNNAEDIPFDLKHRLHIVYGASITKLKGELERYVEHFLANPAQQTQLPAATLEFFISGCQLTDRGEIEVTAMETALNFHFDIFNPSRANFVSSKCKPVVLCDEKLKELTKATYATRLPDGKYMIDLPVIPNTFPSGWTALRFQLARPRGNDFMNGERIPLTIRLYTDLGPKDLELVAIAKVVERKPQFVVER